MHIMETREKVRLAVLNNIHEGLELQNNDPKRYLLRLWQRSEYDS